MSLYGTGRREGIMAVVVMALIVATVHIVGHARSHDWPFELHDVLTPAVLAALGGTLFYRFLRSLDRSRFAAFLAGTAYALAPWLTAISLLPREQCAAALAPLALEVASRSARPDQSRRWLPWAGLLIALPFVAGITTVACLAALLAVVQLGRATIDVEAEDRPARVFGVVCALLTGTAAASSLILLDLAQPWFAASVTPTTIEVLAAHRATHTGLDVAAFVRIPGPVLLLFAVLGVLRWQRRASIGGWISIGLVGAVPTLLLANWPALAELQGDLPALGNIAAASWWVTLLASTVLGAAGLDDFLEMPQRRPQALRLLFVIALAAAPLLLLGASAPQTEWPLVVAVTALAALLVIWRRMGMLPFKNVLAVVAVFAVAVPALQVLTLAEQGRSALVPAALMAEVAAPYDSGSPILRLIAQPYWFYAGLVGALVLSCWLAVVPRRSRKAKTPPASAKTPIA